ncbi:hypothetical protein MLD38_031495 [Melastoma candidum]|uniref:Uncharacterized protein n=1 Tax=Melastoma candidum TaxID=119954 RepID=A0ACB9MRX6_9MYRT|nr:hypothetical protein MLD38_031495 [Melastoma candidum]
MNDFDGLLTSDYGFKPHRKSPPMSSSSSTSAAARDPAFDDLFRPPSMARPRPAASSSSAFDLDSIYEKPPPSSSSAAFDKPPVYDRPPVYDEDIFEGIPGIKTSSAGGGGAGGRVSFDDDVFPPAASVKKGKDGDGFEELLGGFRGARKEEVGDRSGRSGGGGAAFDDLLQGFGVGSGSGSGRFSSAPKERHTSDSARSSEPMYSSSKMMDDPFASLGATTSPHVTTSSGIPTDPLEELGSFRKSESVRAESPFGSTGGAYDDSDPFDGLGKFSSETSNSGKNRRPQGTDRGTSQTNSSKEQVGRSSNAHIDECVLDDEDNGSNRPFFDIPSTSGNSFKSPDHPKPVYEVNSNDAGSPMGMPPEGKTASYDEIWLTVSEVPLLTQPTTAPPPSRPPPPRPARKTTSSSFGSMNAGRIPHEFSSGPYSFDDVKSPPAYSSLDEFEDFATGKNRGNTNDHDRFYNDENGINADAAASAAAMKEAMERAQAKFKQAKEVRERESNRTTRNRDTVQPEMCRDLDNDYDRAYRERQVRLDQDQLQREMEEEERNKLEKEREREEREREQRRLEKERERAREIERERTRKAVERATREARERAAAGARERAAAEVRMKSERAAVEKAHAEARERAGRAAVQRAQSEARERAAIEARERAEKAAAEAKEREAREARMRAERAAVEKAAAEARERAAADARERAAAEVRKRAAAQASQPKNDDDLESFFGMGSRASSAPRPRATSSASETMFETQPQNRKAPDPTRTSTSQSNIRKAASSANIVDDLSSIFGGVSSSREFQEVEGETEERRRARLERHQRTQERAAKALAEKNQRDLQAQREQAERHRIAETLDIEIKRWAAGKEGNLRALLSTLQYVLWPECGWQPVSLTDLITGASVKKVYRKATLCIHPDKVQQKGATLQQKYIAEKVFDLLKEAWNKFNSEELF